MTRMTRANPGSSCLKLRAFARAKNVALGLRNAGLNASRFPGGFFWRLVPGLPQWPEVLPTKGDARRGQTRGNVCSTTASKQQPAPVANRRPDTGSDDFTRWRRPEEPSFWVDADALRNDRQHAPRAIDPPKQGRW